MSAQKMINQVNLKIDAFLNKAIIAGKWNLINLFAKLLIVRKVK